MICWPLFLTWLPKPTQNLEVNAICQQRDANFGTQYNAICCVPFVQRVFYNADIFVRVHHCLVCKHHALVALTPMNRCLQIKYLAKSRNGDVNNSAIWCFQTNVFNICTVAQNISHWRPSIWLGRYYGCITPCSMLSEVIEFLPSTLLLICIFWHWQILKMDEITYINTKNLFLSNTIRKAKVESDYFGSFIPIRLQKKDQIKQQTIQSLKKKLIHPYDMHYVSSTKYNFSQNFALLWAQKRCNLWKRMRLAKLYFEICIFVSCRLHIGTWKWLQTKWYQLFSSGMTMRRTRTSHHELAYKPTELPRMKLKTLNSRARPYVKRALSPLDAIGEIGSHLTLGIYTSVVVH